MSALGDALRLIAAQVDDNDAACTARISALTAERDTLQAELEALRRPGLVAGINLASAHGEPRPWPRLLADHRKLFGGAAFPNLRVFFEPGEAPDWGDPKFVGLTAADRPFVSVKTITEASFRRFLDAMPDRFDRIGFGYWHECEADARKSGRYDAWVAAYLGTYAMLRRVLDDHPNGHRVDLWKILLRYTQVYDKNPRKPGGPPMNADSWRDFHGGQNTPIGMDCYFERWEQRFVPAAEFLAPLLKIRDETGVRISIPELGGIPRNDDRAAAIRDVMDLARAEGVEFVNWWCGRGSAGDHHLEQNPADLAAWQQEMARNG